MRLTICDSSLPNNLCCISNNFIVVNYILTACAPTSSPIDSCVVRLTRACDEQDPGQHPFILSSFGGWLLRDEGWNRARASSLWQVWMSPHLIVAPFTLGAPRSVTWLVGAPSSWFVVERKSGYRPWPSGTQKLLASLLLQVLMRG